MSNVSPKVEHLIRASIDSIKANPETWDQDNWVRGPEDFKAVGDPVPSCGTTYCLGGWMMLYDGWKHDLKWGTHWTKGGAVVEEPWGDILAEMVYTDQGESTPELNDSIFSTRHDSLELLIEKIEGDLDIDFKKECPCLTESNACNLQGCPCGTHTTALDVAPSPPADIAASTLKVVEEFVRESREQGDLITVEQVLADPIMMKAFAAAFMAGEMSLVDSVTKKFNRRLAEVRVQAHGIRAERDRALAEGADLRIGVARLRGGYAQRDLLQGRVDGHFSQSPQFRKLKAKLEREERETARLSELVSKYAPAYQWLKDTEKLFKESDFGGGTAARQDP